MSEDELNDVENTMLTSNRQLDCLGDIVFDTKRIHKWSKKANINTQGCLRCILNDKNKWIILVFLDAKGESEHPFELSESTIQPLPRRFVEDCEIGYLNFAVMEKHLKTIKLDATNELKVEKDKVNLMGEIILRIYRRQTVSVLSEKWDQYTTEYKPDKRVRFLLGMNTTNSRHRPFNRETSRATRSLSPVPVVSEFGDGFVSPEKRRRTVDCNTTFSTKSVRSPSHPKSVLPITNSGKENYSSQLKPFEAIQPNNVDQILSDIFRENKSCLRRRAENDDISKEDSSLVNRKTRPNLQNVTNPTFTTNKSGFSTNPNFTIGSFLSRNQSTSYKGYSASPRRYGFVNLGSTCYMNALLQSLRHVTAFRNLIKSVKGSLDSGSLLKLLNALIEHSDLGVFPTSVLKQINEYFCKPYPRYNIGTQNDVHEFALHLLAHLNTELCKTRPNSPENDRNDAMENPFLWRHTVEHVCQNLDCLEVSQMDVTHTDVELPLASMTLQEMINSYSEPEIIEKKCQKCSNEECSVTIKDKSTPRALMLVLMRFKPDSQGVINKIVEDVYIEEKVKFYNAEYDLSSVIVHQGTAISHGHYLCYVRDDTGSSGGYSKFDDNCVTSLDKVTFRRETKRDGYLCFYNKS